MLMLTGILIGLVSFPLFTVNAATRVKPSSSCERQLQDKVPGNQTELEALVEKLKIKVPLFKVDTVTRMDGSIEKVEPSYYREVTGDADFDPTTEKLVQDLGDEASPINPTIQLKQLTGLREDRPLYIPPALRLLSESDIRLIAAHASSILNPKGEMEEELHALLVKTIIHPSAYEDKPDEKHLLTAANLLLSRAALGRELKIAEDAGVPLKRNFAQEAEDAGFEPVAKGTAAYRFDKRLPEEVLAQGGLLPNKNKRPGTLIDHVYARGFGNGSFVSFSQIPGNTKFLRNPYSKNANVPLRMMDLITRQFQELGLKNYEAPVPGELYQPYDNGANTVNFEYEVVHDGFVRPGENVSAHFVEKREHEVVADQVPSSNVKRYRIVALYRTRTIGFQDYVVVGPWASIETSMEDYMNLFESTKFRNLPNKELYKIGVSGQRRPK